VPQPPELTVAFLSHSSEAWPRCAFLGRERDSDIQPRKCQFRACPCQSSVPYISMFVPEICLNPKRPGIKSSISVFITRSTWYKSVSLASEVDRGGGSM
jgi:hypothetical protein